MKTALLILSFLVTVPATLAEDEKATQEVTISAEKETAEAAAERQKKLQAEERAKAMLEKKPVTYSGFLHDAARAENKRKFFSLRQPRDPKNDIKNISFDERTEKPRGFVLFRMEF
jgi:hypothetical protein